MAYYWLRLKRDFFKRHDIRIVESMDNGKEYVLFYLKLLAEAIDHEGMLRFSEMIPYNEKMLATITDTNVDIVRSAMKVLTELQLIDILDDQTIYMTEVNSMIGGTTMDDQARENNRLRQQRYRERQKELESVTVTLRNGDGNVNRNVDIELDKDIEIDIDKSKKKARKFVPPTVEEVKEYCLSRNNSVDADRFVDFYEAKGWMVGKNKMKDWKAAVRTWEKDSKPKQEDPWLKEY